MTSPLLRLRPRVRESWVVWDAGSISVRRGTEKWCVDMVWRMPGSDFKRWRKEREREGSGRCGRGRRVWKV